MTRVGPLVVLTRLPDPVSDAARVELQQRGWGDPGSRFGSLVARALTADLLTQWWGRPRAALQFSVSAAGKPSVTDRDGAPGPAFSLSHSDTWVAVAIAADGTLGVDVQSFTTPDPRVIRRVFAQSDRELLDALAGEAQSHEFTRLWTIAEACAKADGTGLPLLLRGFSPIGPGCRGSWQRYSWWSGELAGGRWALASDAAGGSDPEVCELPFESVLARTQDLRATAAYPVTLEESIRRSDDAL